jgi:hypothetical protein
LATLDLAVQDLPRQDWAALNLAAQAADGDERPPRVGIAKA